MSIRVLPDILLHAVASYPKSALLRYKSGGAYRDLSTAEVEQSVRRATLGLARLGIEPGDRVAILSETRAEWLLADLAVQCLGAVTVPIYQTLLHEQIEFILNDSSARAIFVSTAEQLAKIREIRDRLPVLGTIIAFEPPDKLAEDLRTWSELDSLGEEEEAGGRERFTALCEAVEPEHLASIIYTSGTTGRPKGVMLTHSNVVTNIVATMEVFPFRADDTGLSLLPLAHVFERVLEYCYLYCGVTIAYAESFEAVPRNVIEVRPTLMAVVPRYFEKFHAGVMEAVRGAPPLRRCLFRWALRVGKSCVPYRLEGRPLPPVLALRARWAHRLVLHRLHDRVGGRLRFFLTGSAPLSAELGEFFWALGLPVYEGYGLTETSPVVAANRPGRTRLGTVGPVIPGVTVRIAGDGEILVSGPNVMQGYYRNEEANREVLQDGWLRTGDIGDLDQNGFLRITDRKKDLFKTSGGKYVAPQPLEGALKLNPYIANAVVIGDRRKFVSALLVPDFENLERFCREGGLGDLPLQDKLEHPQVVELYRRQVEAAMEAWPRYERVKAFRLLPRDFSLEEDEITPTLKVKRKVVERKWESLIDSMYPD